ncbi:ATP-binding cassette domain-containing protein [Cellulomonas sp. NPDC089187]|uniref:ABC transporter ATP-binding protein n=1 Tax=Cellulomonas sp. NPDC089187 TaxID=3154970 RepID=UPI0034266F07
MSAENTQELPPLDLTEETATVTAEGLGMRTGEGWVYRHVDLTASPGDVVEVRGSGGSGRSMLLLTLAGRARPSTGTLSVFGQVHPAQIRPVAAVARVHDVIGPEPEQTVGQAMVERARWDRVHPGGSDGLGYRRDEVRELTGLVAADRERIAGLPRVEQTVIAVALALLSRPRLVLLDDLDVGLSATEQARVWSALHTAADADRAVMIASTAGALPPDTPTRSTDPRGPGAAGALLPRFARLVVDLHPTHVEES